MIGIIAVAVAVVMLLMLVWFSESFLFRWQNQFSIWSLLAASILLAGSSYTAYTAYVEFDAKYGFPAASYSWIERLGGKVSFVRNNRGFLTMAMRPGFPLKTTISPMLSLPNWTSISAHLPKSARYFDPKLHAHRRWTATFPRPSGIVVPTLFGGKGRRQRVVAFEKLNKSEGIGPG